MTQEDKKLLLQDLCARLPYGVYIQHITGIQGKLNNINLLHFYNNTDSVQDVTGITKFFGEDYINITTLKPYLRPMSSMTEEEREELSHYENPVQRTDFYYSHHIDCRFLIEKGLALEAKEGIYEY